MINSNSPIKKERLNVLSIFINFVFINFPKVFIKDFIKITFYILIYFIKQYNNLNNTYLFYDILITFE